MLGRNEQWAIHCIKGQLYHEVAVGKGTKSKPISVRQLMEACADAQMDSGWLPECVRREGCVAGRPFYLAYFLPSVQDSPFAKGGNIRVQTPGMVLIGHGKQYALFMQVDRGEAWREDMCILPAPLPNVYPDGKICFGGNSVPSAKAQNARLVWDLFWKAPFNTDLTDKEKNAVFAAMLNPQGGRLTRAIKGFRKKKRELQPETALLQFLKVATLQEENDE